MSPPLVVNSSHPDVSDGFVLYLLACSLPRLKRAQAIQQQQQQQPGSERFAYQFNGDFQGIGISLDVDEEGRLIVQHVGCFSPQVMCRATPYNNPRAKTSECDGLIKYNQYEKCRFNKRSVCTSVVACCVSHAYTQIMITGGVTNGLVGPAAYSCS